MIKRERERENERKNDEDEGREGGREGGRNKGEDQEATIFFKWLSFYKNALEMVMKEKKSKERF